MTAPSWDILICSIVHRGEMLSALLAELDRQLTVSVSRVDVSSVAKGLHHEYVPVREYRADVRVLCFRDNLQIPYAVKLAAMYAASEADYVCCVDDDDFIAPDYVEEITAALAQEPDYVGFPISYTVDGHPSLPVHHSLRYNCWENRSGILVRDISEKNPMRREIARIGTWNAGSTQPDHDWAKQIRESFQCRTEVWIGAEMYYYRFRSDDRWMTDRAPLADWEPMPAYPWLTMLGEP